MSKKEIFWEKYLDPMDIEDSDLTPVMQTSNGPVVVNKNALPFKQFNSWMMHTNFRITDEIINAIAKTDGVEAIDTNYLTPYRVKICFGKLFDDVDVKTAIENKLIVSTKIVSLKDGLQKLIQQLPSQYPNWAIVIKNEEVNIYGGTDEQSVRSESELSGGTIYGCSWSSGNQTPQT